MTDIRIDHKTVAGRIAAAITGGNSLNEPLCVTVDIRRNVGGLLAEARGRAVMLRSDVSIGREPRGIARMVQA